MYMCVLVFVCMYMYIYIFTHACLYATYNYKLLILTPTHPPYAAVRRRPSNQQKSKSLESIMS